MSRMERYHNVKTDEELPEETPLSKKESKKNNKKKKPAKTPKKQNKKEKQHVSVAHTIGKLLLLVLILVATFCLYEYRKGYREAKHDDDFKQVKVDNFSGVKSSSGGLNILLLGSDSRGKDLGRSDSIMVIHYNKKDKTPKIISFMRDSYVNIPDNGPNKINAAYSFGGPELVRQTLKESFNVDVQYYAIVNFGTFPKVVDSLTPGGLKIDAQKDIELDGINIKKGPQKMDGITALQYARFRKDNDGDFGRVARQQQVVNSLINQGTSVKNVKNLPETIGKIQGYVSTDIPARIYPGIAKDFVLGLSKPLKKLVVPVDDSWSNGYYDHAGSVLELDKEMNTQAIQHFLTE